jgi:hypothetical protein
MKMVEFGLIFFFFFAVTSNSVACDQKPEVLTIKVDPGVQCAGPLAALL